MSPVLQLVLDQQFSDGLSESQQSPQILVPSPVFNMISLATNDDHIDEVKLHDWTTECF